MKADEPITLALFPLTVHVLPGGRLQLRIFEPRYIRMVKEAFSLQADFGICMLNPDGNEQHNTHILPLGTLVKIVDFEQLENNMLGITVEGIQLFEILQIATAADGLRTGKVQLRPNWQYSPLQTQDLILKQRLSEVFDTYPELAQLYPDKQLQDESWICQRWLEILPLEPEKKQQLLLEPQLLALKQFILQLLD
ncbi:LON peptidase substrate-binding domain-containing protein [Rheinheimera sp. WS51]|uniref:LON peptidase substrate-binding domain-containing protein n=1 Tax=Rheinheimera sp. WS51 TaxID=3425886 RepID=UPI003D8AF49B